MSAVAIAFVVSAAIGALLGAAVGVRAVRSAARQPPQRVVGKAAGVAMLFNALTQFIVFAVPAVLLFALADDETARWLGVVFALPAAFVLATSVVANVLFRVRTRRDPSRLEGAAGPAAGEREPGL